MFIFIILYAEFIYNFTKIVINTYSNHIITVASQSGTVLSTLDGVFPLNPTAAPLVPAEADFPGSQGNLVRIPHFREHLLKFRS